jgi:hypothetical protein
MKPKLPLQNHLEFFTKKHNPLDLYQVQTLLDDWKEDYDLMIKLKDVPCIYCKEDVSWILKLNCPREVYKKGYTFLRCYDALREIIEISKLNKECENFYNEYQAFKHNEKCLNDWVVRRKLFHFQNLVLFDKIDLYPFFVFEENNKLEAVKPAEFENFDFELIIKPDAFIGIANFYKLLEEIHIVDKCRLS